MLNVPAPRLSFRRQQVRLHLRSTHSTITPENPSSIVQESKYEQIPRHLCHARAPKAVANISNTATNLATTVTRHFLTPALSGAHSRVTARARANVAWKQVTPRHEPSERPRPTPHCGHWAPRPADYSPLRQRRLSKRARTNDSSHRVM